MRGLTMIWISSSPGMIHATWSTLTPLNERTALPLAPA